MNNSYQSIQFTTSDQNLFGIFEFKGNYIIQTYFHNAYKSTFLGTQRSKDLLVEQFDFFLNNLDLINLRSVDSIEVKLKADDITPTDHGFNNVNENNDLKTPRIFRKFEDSSVVILSFYYASKTNNVKFIKFEWEGNAFFDNEIFIFSKEQLLKQKYRQTMLADKMSWIMGMVSDKCGKPVKDIKGINFRKINWECSGISINLEGGYMNTPECYNSVELTISKK